MKSRILSIAKWLLLIWGGLSLAGAIVFVAWTAYRLGPGNRDKDDFAGAGDVQFVLNRCPLNNERIVSVIHSYVSANGFGGDHLDAYAIRISRFDLTEVTAKPKDGRTRWYRSDELPPVLDDAVKFANAVHGKISWFPTDTQLKSSDFYIFPWRLSYEGVGLNGAELILFRPSDGMIFYLDGQAPTDSF